MNQVASSTTKVESTNMPSTYSNKLNDQEDACDEKNEVSTNSEQASNLNFRSESSSAPNNETSQTNSTIPCKRLKNMTENEASTFRRITYDMTQKMKEARGVKRGRKVLDFTEYCNKTTRRIDELKLILINTDATEEKKKQVRNQISAF